jgi:hypothetical protein
VSQHKDQAATQVIDCVFNASQVFIVDDVSGDAADEQITETLIKNNLRRHPRIGATDDDGERMLRLCQFCAPCRRLTGMLQIAAGITTIAFLELGDRFRRSY